MYVKLRFADQGLTRPGLLEVEMKFLLWTYVHIMIIRHHYDEVKLAAQADCQCSCLLTPHLVMLAMPTTFFVVTLIRF